jgi:uncharacterized protein (DUF2141 family)
MYRSSEVAARREHSPAPGLRRTLACLTLTAAALSAQAADVTIDITGIEATEGMIHWALFDSADSYAGDGSPVIAAQSRVTGEAVSATVHGLPEGRYAVRLFHDSNGNGELDRNMLGIPREAYGFSNDAGSRGPASFDDAAVVVEGDARIAVQLR